MAYRPYILHFDARMVIGYNVGVAVQLDIVALSGGVGTVVYTSFDVLIDLSEACTVISCQGPYLLVQFLDDFGWNEIASDSHINEREKNGWRSPTAA